MPTLRTFGVALLLGSAAATTPSDAPACGDCCKGGFSKPLLYFYWRNTSAADCCTLCAANATCAFSIWQPPNAGSAALGHCFPSPAAASGWHGSGSTTTCRSARAPPWPAPPPPPPPRQQALPLWPAPNAETARVSKSGGPATAVASQSFKVSCAAVAAGEQGGQGLQGECPSAALAWYASAVHSSGNPAALPSAHPAVNSLRAQVRAPHPR